MNDQIDYGKGKRQRQIIILGENDKLTFGDFLKLFGETKSYEELERLIDLGYAVIDETIEYDSDLSPQTKIKWLLPH